jgi:hypothetical protein
MVREKVAVCFVVCVQPYLVSIQFQMSGPFFHLDLKDGVRVLRLQSEDGTNRLTRECVFPQSILPMLGSEGRPLLITGNEHFFGWVGLGPDCRARRREAYEFSRMI